MNYPPNPEYGTGIFRRRIAISCLADSVEVELEDCNHAFRLRLVHDGSLVTHIVADAIRYPLSTCGTAPEALSEFVGTPLSEWRRADLRRRSSPRKNCTHLYDMLGLGLAQIARREASRIYDVAIPDFDQSGAAEIRLDGCLMHQWVVSRTEVIQPTHLKGRPLASGFSRWAEEVFEGDRLEAAYVLQMGIFTAQGRRFDVDAMAGAPVAPTRIPLGACYSYQQEQIKNAVRCAGSTRDFTDDRELLRFV